MRVFCGMIVTGPIFLTSLTNLLYAILNCQLIVSLAGERRQHALHGSASVLLGMVIMKPAKRQQLNPLVISQRKLLGKRKAVPHRTERRFLGCARRILLKPRKSCHNRSSGERSDS